MTVDGISKSNGASEPVPPKGTSGRRLRAGARSVGEACLPTGRQANVESTTPRRTPSQEASDTRRPSVHGGNWKVKQTKTMKKKTYGHAIGVACRGPGGVAGTGSHERDTATVVGCGRTHIGGSDTARQPRGQGVPALHAGTPFLSSSHRSWAGDGAVLSAVARPPVTAGVRRRPSGQACGVSVRRRPRSRAGLLRGQVKRS
jgi:hypothetical protein